MQSKSIVFNLSLKDLKHEWILTLCLVMAISAVLAPLLLLFGLKYGIIEWGQTYLKENPLYREIRPMASKSFSKEWFEHIGKREDVIFVTPMTRQIAATVKGAVRGREAKTELNIIPTNDGDPLLLENGASIPKAGECVLTQFAAESLSAAVGDTVEIKAGRIIGSRYEYGVTDLKVSGILSVRASELKSLYVRLPVLEAVERYRDGQAVPEFGWSGSTPKAYPLYDGLLVVLPRKLGKVEEFSLCNRTGFTKIESLSPEAIPGRTAFNLSPDMAVYRLYTMKKPVNEDSIRSVKNRLRGKDASLFPLISPIKAQVLDKNKTLLSDISLYSLSSDSEVAQTTGLSVMPEWKGAVYDGGRVPPIMLPPGIKTGDGPFYIRIAKNSTESLTFPVQPASSDSGLANVGFVPSEVAGILNLYESRNIHFDPNVREFILFRRGYAGFRLYAKSVFDVDGLRKYFEAAALPVHTEIREIKKVIELDKGMTLIFWLLAVVGIAGSVASLTASLYASVERKKREMSVLRLIGLSGPTLFRFPVYQGVLIGSGGFLTSMILFGIFSRLINNFFRPYADKLLGFPMEAGISFCRLPPGHVIGAFTVTALIAALAAVISALRIAGIEPAEALRDE